MVSIILNRLRIVLVLPNWASQPWQPALGACAGCSESLAGWTCANFVPDLRIKAIHLQTWYHLPGFLFLFLCLCLFLGLVLFLFSFIFLFLFLVIFLFLFLYLFLLLFLFLCPCLFSVSRPLLLSLSLPLALPMSLVLSCFSIFSLSNSFLLSCCLSLFLFEIAYPLRYIMSCLIPDRSIMFYYVVLLAVRFVRAFLCVLLCCCIVLSLPFYSTILHYMLLHDILFSCIVMIAV